MSEDTSKKPPEAEKKPTAAAVAKEETLDERNQRLRRAALAEFEKDKAAGKLATGYVIAAGKAVTSKIGIIAEGEPVAPKHFFNGQEDFDRLFELGLITKGQPKS